MHGIGNNVEFIQASHKRKYALVGRDSEEWSKRSSATPDRRPSSKVAKMAVSMQIYRCMHAELQIFNRRGYNRSACMASLVSTHPEI